MHTAVKIEPQYRGPVVHVLDASRSVPVAQTLLDASRHAEFEEDIADQYRCASIILLGPAMLRSSCSADIDGSSHNLVAQVTAMQAAYDESSLLSCPAPCTLLSQSKATSTWSAGNCAMSFWPASRIASSCHCLMRRPRGWRCAGASLTCLLQTCTLQVKELLCHACWDADRSGS